MTPTVAPGLPVRHTRHAVWRHASRRVHRYLRTPKGLLAAVLTGLTAVAARVEGVAFVAPGVASAVGAAMLLDAGALRWRRGRWVFPAGAMLTGLLIGSVLSSFEPWYVAAAASVVGIGAKHLVRSGSANVFNPAALGLVVVFLVFDTAQNWWGALPAIVPAAAWPLLLGSGILVAHRVHKLPLVLSFATAYFILFTVATVRVDPADVAEVFVAPDLLAFAYFAGFMLTDPPTSPTRTMPQVLCGGLVALVSVGVFLSSGAAHYLLVGALAGNLFETVRRGTQRRARP